MCIGWRRHRFPCFSSSLFLFCEVSGRVAVLLKNCLFLCVRNSRDLAEMMCLGFVCQEPPAWKPVIARLRGRLSRYVARLLFGLTNKSSAQRHHHAADRKILLVLCFDISKVVGIRYDGDFFLSCSQKSLRTQKFMYSSHRLRTLSHVYITNGARASSRLCSYDHHS